ncbi:MAG: RHS repeat-associated core domain-containing protein [Bacteroidota bacterium]
MNKKKKNNGHSLPASDTHWDDFTVYHGKTNVVESSDYYPDVLTFNSYQRTASTPNRYKFQGHEWLEEMRWYDFGPRGWDPLTWRTNAQDILANKFPDQSSYSLFRNNPILFIDPDGRWPYTFHIRSFVTNSSFAGGFKGRGSGFSTDVGALSKIHQYVTYETNGGYIADQGFKSTMSAWYPGVAGAFSIPFRFPLNLAIGKVNPSGSAIANGNGFSGLMRAGNAVTEKWLWGGMGAIQPEIDMRYSVQLNESDDGLLSLSLQAEGDGFPDAEAFVIDKKGNQIFVGGYSKNSYGSPFWSLGGEGDTQMMNSNFQIMTNGKGIFTGVKYDGQEYSIEEWNGASDGSMTLEEFKEDYGDLYNMMFNNR